MSRRFPIVAVTGSSGAGNQHGARSLQHMFRREGIKAAVGSRGAGFHRYTRCEMPEKIREAEAAGQRISHFGPLRQLWPELEALFRDWSLEGRGRYRHYLHNKREADKVGSIAGTGTFTPCARMWHRALNSCSTRVCTAACVPTASSQ